MKAQTMPQDTASPLFAQWVTVLEWTDNGDRIVLQLHEREEQLRVVRVIDTYENPPRVEWETEYEAEIPDGLTVSALGELVSSATSVDG